MDPPSVGQRRQAGPPSRACTRTVPGRSTRTRVMPPGPRSTQARPPRHRPPARVADPHERVAAARGAQREAVGLERDRARGAAHERGGPADRVDAPVRVAPDRAEVGRAPGDELRLVACGAVQRDVGHGDVGHRVLVEPRAVRRRGERAVVEERAVAPVELALPAARERDVRSDVCRLPVVLGERDLHAEAAAATLEEAHERGVVGGRGRRVAVRPHDVAHRGIQLPVGQRQDERREDRSPAGRGQDRSGEDRAGEQRPEPGRVAAERGRDDERGDARQRVDRRAGPQRPLARRERAGDERDRDERGPEGRRDERLGPALGEQQGEDRGGRERAGGNRRAAATVPWSRQRERHGGDRDEEARDRAGERRQGGERAGEQPALALEGDHRAEADRDAEHERQPAADERRDEPDGEPRRRDAPGARAPAALGDETEQRRRHDRGERARQPHAEQRAERRREEAVGGRVVAGEPAVVPQAETRVADEPGAVLLRGVVGGRGIEEQVRGGAERRDDARPPRSGHGGGGAGSPARWRMMRSQSSGRSSQGQCPASSIVSSVASPRLAA